MSIRLSVVIISKNSAAFLPECLGSIDWVDEIILFDSGSIDSTVEIARVAGAKVFIDNKNWKGYGIQRQRAQRFATGNYILMMDVDERVTPQLRESIQFVLSTPKTGVVYSIARRNYFLGRFIRYSGWYPDYVIRLYERQYYEYNNKQVHESLSYKDAKVISLKGEMLHLTCQDLSSFQFKQLHYAVTWSQENHQRIKKISLTSIFCFAIYSFIKTLLLRKGFLDGKYGLILAAINAQYTFNKYIGSWILNRTTFKEEDKNYG